MTNTRPLLAAALILPALALPACSQQQDHKRMARAYLNGPTAEQTLAAASMDFQLWIGDREGTPIDRNDVRRLYLWDDTLNTTITIRRLTSRGVTAIATIHEENDFSRLLEHPGWDATVTFWFNDEDHGGLISDILYEPDPNNPHWNEYLQHALPYLQTHHAETLDDIYPNQSLVQTAESARAWRTILTDWRQTLDLPTETN